MRGLNEEQKAEMDWMENEIQRLRAENAKLKAELANAKTHAEIQQAQAREAALKEILSLVGERQEHYDKQAKACNSQAYFTGVSTGLNIAAMFVAAKLDELQQQAQQAGKDPTNNDKSGG